MMKNLFCVEYEEWKNTLSAGDEVELSGTVFTARDAAHRRMFEIYEAEGRFPFEIKRSFIYYAGPTPAAPGKIIGSCGPTTSSRMDVYAPRLYDLGLAGTIGKGPRSQGVIDSIKSNGAVYFLALGGVGALAAKHITSLDVVCFDDLGCESIKKLTFDRFPLIVGIDHLGNSVF